MLVIGQAEVEASATQFQWRGHGVRRDEPLLPHPAARPSAQPPRFNLVEQKRLGFDALRLLRHRSFAVFLLELLLDLRPFELLL